jgi:two-component system, cell cycle sensor histidine kinase and response regulator CckA
MDNKAVLIVEDDAIIAENLREMLEEIGYTAAKLVATGEGAVSAATSLNPALVLMDIKLAGDIDGIQAAAEIHRTSDVPVIFLTAYAENQNIERAKETNPYGYLIKPITTRELKAAIDVALHRYSVDRQLAANEKALRESEETHRALLELGGRCGEAIVMLRDEGKASRYVYCNERWLSLTGYSQAELSGMSFFDLVHPRMRQASLERHKARLAGEVQTDFQEMTIVRKDGREAEVEGSFAYSLYKGNPVDIGYLRDISARKQLQEQMIITDRLATIGDMASSISHELNNPLTSVVGFTGLLQQRTDLPAEAREMVEAVFQGAKRASEVTRRLALFANRRGSGVTMLEVNELVAQALELRAHELAAQHIEVKTSLTPDLPLIEADGFLLQQVILNVIANAEYFLSEAKQGGKLSIKTSLCEGAIQIQVQDNGPGLATGSADSLFGSFLGLSTMGKGSGFGMSVCHWIMSRMGGTINLQGERGRGTEVTIRLPAGETLPGSISSRTSEKEAG